LPNLAGNRIKSAFTMTRSNCYTDMAEDHELATEKVDTALDVLGYFNAAIFTSDGCWANPTAALSAIRESITLLQSAEAIALRGLKAESITKRRAADTTFRAEAESRLIG
jgi:hypothetical protein